MRLVELTRKMGWKTRADKQKLMIALNPISDLAEEAASISCLYTVMLIEYRQTASQSCIIKITRTSDDKEYAFQTQLPQNL